MNIDKTLRLETVLAGAVSTVQPVFHVDYMDWTNANEQTAPQTFRGALNSATDVVMLAAPVSNPRREVLGWTIYNGDNASVTVTVKTDDGTTERIITKVTLATLETLAYDKNSGIYALTVAGGRK